MKNIFLWATLIALISFSAKGADNIIYNPAHDGMNDNPLSYYLNGALDVTQNANYFTQKDYIKNHEKVWDKIINMGHWVKKDGGWDELFKQEVFADRFLPNFGLHFLGGGYDYRYFYEYFRHRNTWSPETLAFLTMYVTKFGNEALEASATNERINSLDHIADLFLFDLAGVFAFQNEKFVRFWYDTMQMRRWTFQPMYNIKEKRVRNAGLNYIFRPKLLSGDYEHIRPFFFLGLQTLLGVSIEISENEFISFGAGLAYVDPIASDLKRKGKATLGVFYDRDDLLAASLHLNTTEQHRIKLNLYPSLLSVGNYKFGVFGAYDNQDNIHLGLNLAMGVGLEFQSYGGL